MFEKILSVAGKPGLYSLVSRGNNSLIVESIDGAKHRMPVFLTTKVIALDNISMYTNNEEVPLRIVMENIQKKYNGGVCPIDPKTADTDSLFDFLGEVLPEYDGDRIYSSDVKKLISWYNILVENNMSDFSDPDAASAEEAADDAAEKPAKKSAAKKSAAEKPAKSAKSATAKTEQKAARKVAPKTAEKKAAPVKSANRKAQ